MAFRRRLRARPFPGLLPAPRACAPLPGVLPAPSTCSLLNGVLPAPRTCPLLPGVAIHGSETLSCYYAPGRRGQVRGFGGRKGCPAITLREGGGRCEALVGGKAVLLLRSGKEGAGAGLRWAKRLSCYCAPGRRGQVRGFGGRKRCPAIAFHHGDGRCEALADGRSEEVFFLVGGGAGRGSGVGQGLFLEELEDRVGFSGRGQQAGVWGDAGGNDARRAR